MITRQTCKVLGVLPADQNVQLVCDQGYLAMQVLRKCLAHALHVLAAVR